MQKLTAVDNKVKEKWKVCDGHEAGDKDTVTAKSTKTKFMVINNRTHFRHGENNLYNQTYPKHGLKMTDYFNLAQDEI